MLREWESVRQRPEEGHREWYFDDEMDLVVWKSERGGVITGFQLCYDKQYEQKALSWNEQGITHNLIDSGESEPGSFKATAILSDQVPIDVPALERDFKERAVGLSDEVRELVLSVLRSVPMSAKEE